MVVFLYVTENMYQGLHGIYNAGVIEVDSFEETCEYANEWGDYLVSSFGLEDECGPEDDYINWNAWAIKEEFAGLPMRELDRISAKLGPDAFRDKYCEVDAIW